MSLDVYLRTEDGEVYSANITHNLGVMAKEAGIYMYLWRPEELGITKARDLIETLGWYCKAGQQHSSTRKTAKRHLTPAISGICAAGEQHETER